MTFNWVRRNLSRLALSHLGRTWHPEKLMYYRNVGIKKIFKFGCMKVLLRIFLRVWRRIWCTSRETYLRFHLAEAWKVFTTGFNGYSNNSKFSRNYELICFRYFCILISNSRFYICNHLSRHCLWNHFVGMLCLPNNISNIFNLQKQEGVVKSVHICSKEIFHCTHKNYHFWSAQFWRYRFEIKKCSSWW